MGKTSPDHDLSTKAPQPPVIWRPPTDIADNLCSETVSGLSWTTTAQAARQLLQFTITAILAHLLSPRDFGLISMIFVFTGFAELFTDLGLGAAVIQKLDVKETQLNSVFWANVAVGGLLTVIAAACAPLVAIFYREPLLTLLTVAAALNFLIGSLKVVPKALLRRSMRFRRLFWIDTASVAAAGLAAVTTAIAGLGVWSLVAESLALTLVGVAMTWAVSPWRPTLSFDAAGLRGLLAYGLNLLGHDVTDYWIRNLDSLLVGRYIGSAALGVYVRSYNLMLLPIGQVSSVVSSVMFPALSAIQHDRERIKRIYLRSTAAIALVTFPMMIGLAVVAEPFVLVVFGSQWREMIVVTQVLCLAGAMQSVEATVGWIYTATGHTDIMFKWSLLAAGVTLPAFVIGLRWGVVGISLAYVITNYAFLSYPSWAIPGHLINMRVKEMVGNLAGYLGCSIVMGATVWVLGLALPRSWPQWARLLTLVSSGIVVYGLLIHALRLRAYLEVRALGMEQARQVWRRFRAGVHQTA